MSDTIIDLSSTAGDTQGLRAINTMDFIGRALRGWALPLVIPVARACRVFDAEGIPLDSSTNQQLKLLGAEVFRAA